MVGIIIDAIIIIIMIKDFSWILLVTIYIFYYWFITGRNPFKRVFANILPENTILAIWPRSYCNDYFWYYIWNIPDIWMLLETENILRFT